MNKSVLLCLITLWGGLGVANGETNRTVLERLTPLTAPVILTDPQGYTRDKNALSVMAMVNIASQSYNAKYAHGFGAVVLNCDPNQVMKGDYFVSMGADKKQSLHTLDNALLSWVVCHSVFDK